MQIIAIHLKDGLKFIFRKDHYQQIRTSIDLQWRDEQARRDGGAHAR
jgi:hypothetical protein